jgi:type VI secretion system VasD/TssJ family lipoprotein
MRTQRSVRPILAALALLGAGCSLVPWFKGEGAPIRVILSAGSRLNPDEQGESLPTAVRVYQLSGVANAQRVDLTDLIRDPKTHLGVELLGVEELVVAPGGTAEKVFPRAKEASALLIAGLFRRPAGTGWREIVELSGRGARVEIRLEDYRLERQ